MQPFISMLVSILVAGCPHPPVVGPVLQGFAPAGSYAGHWGVDVAAPVGTSVRAAGGGVVTFSGSVAGRLTVTVRHEGDLRTSYSYLESIAVVQGQSVVRGQVLGLSGAAHGTSALHVSLRVGPRYVDPEPWLACRILRPPGDGLSLAPTLRFILPPVRRGILGGTFDPPHIAHLVAGESAYRQLALDVVTFLPAGAPWQKAGRLVSPGHHRLAMTEAAVSDVDYFETDDREVRRDGWTYTADTLATFSASDELVLILGADAAAGLLSWQRPDEVLGRASVAVAPRPGVARELVTSVLPDAFWLDVPPLPVSGTALRERRAERRSIRFLVPDPVYRYIEDHDLYE